jgi:hypothetical protein
MKFVLGLVSVTVILLSIGFYYEGKRNPYEVGMHMDYSITCEDGFIYKTLSNRRGTIHVLNSDGTPLKCGHKRF